MLKRIAFLCFLLLFWQPLAGFTNDDEAVLLKKSQLLVQKGTKAEGRGDIEEAVASYEEAHQAYPKNILPLLKWGSALCRIGMYSRASELLAKIPVDKLPRGGQTQVHLLNARIAIANGTVEAAAAAYSLALKASDKSDVARVRLALINNLLGMESRAEELLRDHDSFAGLSHRDLVVALFADLQAGNIGRAFHTSGEIARTMAKASYEEHNEPFLLSLWQVQPVTFLVCLPLALGGLHGLMYYFALFAGLVFLATRLSNPTAIWHNVLFIVLAIALLMGAQVFIKRDLMLAIMSDEFSANDNVWIIPRLLVSGHLLALALFAIFPCFKLLPEEQRPRRYEFYGIWFFCWWFIVFVLVFQSRLGFGTRVTYLAISFLLASMTTFFMPLGRYVLYKITNFMGYGDFADVSRQNLQTKAGIGFTDAKILEAKSWKLIERDEFEEVVLTARKVLGNLDRKTFPVIWKAMIMALLMREDFVEAQQHINEFLEAFQGTPLYESGQLYEALLRSRKGDFASSLKLIRGFSDDRVKSFSPDETALCLLVLGRCDLAYKENVQAHIDLTKAFNCARLPIIKSDALVEIVGLDFQMNSKDALGKWKAKAFELSGGEKTMANRQLILSIIAQSEGQKDEALKLAFSACEGKIVNSKACAWYGHLLCLAGQHNDAESLLSKMAPDSIDAEKLMTEVTGSSS